MGRKRVMHLDQVWSPGGGTSKRVKDADWLLAG